jgi:alkylation response protein AidB-like acyl-CoA dehydrogenase
MTEKNLTDWLDREAECLDSSMSHAELVLSRIAAAGVLKAGIPASEGGEGGEFSDAVRVIADLAEHSLTAAFVCWAQRAVIECLLQTPNHVLARQWLPSLLDGHIAGAPGLSNAMKALSGIGEMQVQFKRQPGGFTLDGQIPWMTNVHNQGFLSVIAAHDSGDNTYSVFAVPHHAKGVKVGGNLDLMALRASNTFSLRLVNAELDEHFLIHRNAKLFLPALRPAFLGLQSGMAIGLSRASLRAARESTSAHHMLLQEELDALEYELGQCSDLLFGAVNEPAASGATRRVLEARINCVDLALRSVQLELQALGSKAYSATHNSGFARRWREAAFLPILTPSIMHLKTELARQALPA